MKRWGIYIEGIRTYFRSLTISSCHLILLPGAGCYAPLSFFVVLACLLSFSHAMAASVDLTWNPNTEPDLAGYKIYWGTSSSHYSSSKDVGKTTTCTINGVEEGTTYYFVATAYDNQENESEYSNQVAFTVPLSDSDGDGVPNTEDAFPSDPSETTDTDGDGIGDNADDDDDNDQMPDAWEIEYGFDPLRDDATEDADGDGISNRDEYLAGSDPMVPQTNDEPEPPSLSAPAHDQVVESTPVLKTAAFQDSDADDFHSATRWRIFRNSDDVCVFDIISEYSLTEIQIPKLILEGNNSYSWQAKHYDRHGIASEWSSSSSFITQADAEDSDGNGIPDGQEVDSLTDLDEDGTWDVDQDTIKCIDAGDGKSLGISIKDSNNVVAIVSVWVEQQDEDLSPKDASGNPEKFPFGLINFKLIMSQPGDTAEIRIYFSEPAPDNGRWLKYDPIEATWTDYSSQSDFSDDRRFLALHLEDGGEGDADGISNGIIVDPSGVAVSSSGSGSSGSWSDSLSGLSDLSSCFITSTSLQAGPITAGQIWKTVCGRELAIGLVLLAMLKIMAVALRRMRQRWEDDQRRFELYHEQGGRFTARDLIRPKKLKRAKV